MHYSGTRPCTPYCWCKLLGYMVEMVATVSRDVSQCEANAYTSIHEGTQSLHAAEAKGAARDDRNVDLMRIRNKWAGFV
jgi:hypothetical protein